MEKLIKDGKVAVIISPGFGVGWSTWATSNEEKEFLLFDKTLAQMVIDKKDRDVIVSYVMGKFPDVYTGGAGALTVVWVNQGDGILITEYDGAEGIRTRDSHNWIIA
jgi:hypothetical protein